jgi:uridine kinase
MKNSVQHVITISGGSGCGKSTLTRMIKEHLGEENILHIEHDEFYKPAKKLKKTNGWINFDTPTALQNDLLVKDIQTLLEGKSVTLPDYDFMTQSSKKGVTVEPKPVIILEGIFVLCIPEIRRIADTNIFVDVDGEVRLARRVIRDFIRKERSDMGEAGYEDDIWYYLNFVKAGFDHYVLPCKKYADFIVDNSSDTPDRMVSRTKEFLLNKNILK